MIDPSIPVAQPADDRRHPTTAAVWAVVAAFGAYFCMYAFRKPFTAAGYEGASVAGVGLKTALVTAQVLGYTLSKFVGIRLVSELPPRLRAAGVVGLVCVAELALVASAVVPRPWTVACLFVNGLPLGMVFGLVLAPLEGRRLTELLAAGLCASFILADGVMKSVGAELLVRGVPEAWMPAAAGGLFLGPTAVFAAMLHLIHPPTEADRAARSPRGTMRRADRQVFLARHGRVVASIVAVYVLLTVVRSIRADFAPEIWRALGVEAAPAAFTQTEFWVALVVLAASGAAVLVHDNGRGFAAALATCLMGFVILAVTLVLHEAGLLEAFPFMVLTGLGLYLPYVTIHTAVFERLLALAREPGTVGYLMTLADAFGYLAYVVVMLSRGLLAGRADPLTLFSAASWAAVAVSSFALALAWLARPRPAAALERRLLERGHE